MRNFLKEAGVCCGKQGLTGNGKGELNSGQKALTLEKHPLGNKQLL